MPTDTCHLMSIWPVVVACRLACATNCFALFPILSQELFLKKLLLSHECDTNLKVFVIFMLGSCPITKVCNHQKNTLEIRNHLGDKCTNS